MADNEYARLLGEDWRKEADEAKKWVREMSKMVVGLNGNIVNTFNKLKKGGDQSNILKMQQDLARATAALTKATQAYEKAKYSEAKATTEAAKASMYEAKAKTEATKAQDILNRAKDRADKLAQKEEANARKLTSAYEQLKKKERELFAEAAHLAVAEGKLSQAFKEKYAAQQAAYRQLLEVEVAMGRSQRMVGQYTNATFALSQTLRELPAFAFSVQTGLLGISNNIPILLDNFKKLREETGSNAKSLKILLGSMFTATNLITIAIGVITIMGDKLFTLGKATDAATKASERAVDIYAEETTQLSLLNKELEDVNISQDRLRQIRDELVKRYPALRDNLQGEENLNIRLSNAIRNVTEALKERAIIRAAEELIVEENKKLLKGEMDGWNMFLGFLQGAVTGPNGMPAAMGQAAARSVKETESNIDRLFKVIEKAQAKLKASGLDTILGGDTDKTEKLRQETEEIKQLSIVLKELKEDSDNLIAPLSKDDPISERQQQIQILMLEEATRLRLLEESYASGLSTYEEYQKGKEDIARNVTEKIIELQIEELKAQLMASGLTKEQIADINRRITELAGKLAQIRRGGESNSESESFWSKDYKNIVKWMDKAVEASTVINSLMKRRTDREIEDLDRRNDALTRSYDNEVNKITVSGLAADEKERKIQEAFAETERERQNIDAERIKAQKRQAGFDRALAVTKAFISMFQGIGKEVETKGVAGLATGAAITAYMSGIIGLIGAIAIPEYAEGTDNHPGGLAKVGDGGEHELVKLPSGKMFLSPNRTTTMFLPKGTEVLPPDKLAASGDADLMMKAAMMMPIQYGDTKALEAAFEKSVAKIPQTTFNLTDTGLQKTVKMGNRTVTYLNSNTK